METLTSTTTSSVSFPIVSSFKSRDAPLRRHIRFSTYCKNNINNDGESDLKSESIESALVKMNPIISKDEAMGLVLSAVNGSGWTTGSGMEGPALSAGSDSGSGTEQVSTFPWSLFTKSPRRRLRVAFTCNVCGQRTTRAINPHAYTDGTVFVQCCGCNIFHKLVDNLNLFHGMKCYVNSSFNPNPNNSMNVKYFDLEDNNGESDDNFPLM